MKITLSCIFPEAQSAGKAARTVKKSGYDIEKVSVFSNPRTGINPSNGFFERTYIPLAESGESNLYPEIGNLYPTGQISSIAAAGGFGGIFTPLDNMPPAEIADTLKGRAYLQCSIASHQAPQISKILSDCGGDDIKTYKSFKS